MYSAIAISTAIRPVKAFREISAPQVGPMSWIEMSVRVIPACFASASPSPSVCGSPVRDAVRIETWSPFTICTSASGRPNCAIVSTMSATVTSWTCNG